ncbi:MAG: hypothetical protein U1D33_01500 [bacterium]|nr:hypothetical protein [bacterium]
MEIFRDNFMPNPISPQPRQPIKIAIGNVTSKGAHPIVVRNIETVITDNVGSHAELDVINYEEIIAMLNLEEKKQMAGCESDVSCLAEIGGAMGVDKLITGSVGFLGENYIISLQLIDIQRAQVESRAQARVKQGDEKDFLEATDQATQRLIAPILCQEPSTPWRTFQILKWSSLVFALGSFGLGAERALRSRSKENSYDTMLGDLENTGLAVPSGQNFVFRNDAAKSKYKPTLDALKKESRDAATFANISFVAGTLSMAAAGVFFYLDHSSQKTGSQPLSHLFDFSLERNGAFGLMVFSF